MPHQGRYDGMPCLCVCVLPYHDVTAVLRPVTSNESLCVRGRVQP